METARKAKTARLIGLEGMILPFVEPFVKEGKMPTFKKLTKEGSFGSAWSESPTAMQPSWTFIQTEAYPGESGVCDSLGIPDCCSWSSSG